MKTVWRVTVTLYRMLNRSGLENEFEIQRTVHRDIFLY